MRAAQFFAKGDIRVLDVPEPVPKPHEVLVSVEWGGICGTDLHEYIKGPLVIPSRAPHPLTQGLLTPTNGITMGHEFCGRIVHVPADSTSSLKVGQAVMVDPRLYCKSCTRCNHRATNACNTWGFLGLSGGGGGGFSETVAVEPSMCYVLPEGMDLSVAALIEPLAVAAHAINTCGVEDLNSQYVLVMGGGPIGIAVLHCLRAKRVEKLIVSEPTAKRREQAGELAEIVLDPVKESVAERCMEITGGVGVGVVFDCAGVQRGLDAGMEALGHGGTYMNVAGWETPFVLPFRSFLFKEVTVKSSFAYTERDFKETVDAFAAGKFKGVEKMVTSRIGLEDIVGKGFEELVEHRDDHVKIVVTPRREKLG